MAYFVIPSRRTRQPSGAVRARGNGPFSRGLRFAMPSPLAGDVVNGNRLTFGAGGSVTPTRQGNALTGNGTQACATIPLNMSSSYLMTAAFWLEWNTYANDDDFAFELTTNTNTNVGGFAVDPNAAGGTFQFYALRSAGSSGGWTISRPSAGLHHYVITLTQNTTSLPGRCWIDGTEVTTTQLFGTAAFTNAFANSTLYLFSRANTSLFGNGKLAGLTFWDWQFDSSAASELYASGGWDVYQPDTRRVYFDAGAGGGAVTGTLAATDGADSAAFSGTHTANATGTLAATEGADSADFSGTEAFTGTIAATDGADSAAFSGSSVNGVAGTLAATDGADNAAFSGTHTATATGTLAATDGADAAAFVGIFLQNITGALAATDGADRASFAGTGGGIWTDINRESTSWSNLSPASPTWTNL